ncbi:uncharacterized protein LOC114659723 isoform X2 [Erpetoichthys calabaricus]|nr:uncharacterized protein LOC114659723 isoform X2 [Erpetoichthys calabaricus]
MIEFIAFLLILFFSLESPVTAPGIIMVFLSLESLRVFLLLMFQQQVTGRELFHPQYYVEATEESKVTLTCAISRATQPSSMMWYKAIGGECTHVYSFPPMGEGNDPRVTWTEDPSLLNFSITIRDVKVNDTGEYFCEMHRKLLWDMHCMFGRRITLTVRGSYGALSNEYFPFYILLLEKMCLLVLITAVFGVWKWNEKRNTGASQGHK